MKSLGKIAITTGEVQVNGKPIFRAEAKSDMAFFKEIYTILNLVYPKFYKMDEVSKLCFLGVELLLENSTWTRENGTKTALVVATTDGCKQSDLKHFASISRTENSLPSPATFVYTLPNIMLGEACIRHGITGENMCLITTKHETAMLAQYSKIILNEKDTEFCISGYINYQPENYQCNLSLFAKA